MIPTEQQRETAMTNFILNELRELNTDELEAVSGGGIIGDAAKAIGAMMSAVNEALANAAKQQLLQTINLAGEVAATPPNLPGL
jgi:bacteriocin-like protein